jgi:hypothetical protein
VDERRIWVAVVEVPDERGIIMACIVKRLGRRICILLG